MWSITNREPPFKGPADLQGLFYSTEGATRRFSLLWCTAFAAGIVQFQVICPLICLVLDQVSPVALVLSPVVFCSGDTNKWLSNAGLHGFVSGVSGVSGVFHKNYTVENNFPEI